MTLRGQLLGPLLVDGRAGTAVVPAAKQRVLLAALALRAGHAVSYDELAEAAWNEDASETARVAVRNYVLRLRRALGEDGPRIVTRDPGYLRDVSLDEVDVLAFDELCEAGGASARAGKWPQAGETLSRALGMWRGTPLADIPSQALNDKWIRHLDQARLGALRHRIRADLWLGRHEAVTGELRALTAEHRLDEELWALLLLALYRSGFQGDAMAAYRQAREALIADLGVEPGPNLSRLHRQILSHDPALDSPAGREAPQRPGTGVPRQLPAPLSAFAGRARELGFLWDLLDGTGRDGGTVVISAIGGTAGVGKTTLAVYFARRAAGRFPDGQLYVNLRGYHPSGEPVTPGQAIRGFLDALGVAPDGIPKDLDAQCALYRSLLAGKRMLVLLDNARDAAQNRPLLPGSPGCLVLVTSRNSLASLAVTDGARLLGLDLLAEAEARDLLVARLGAAVVAAEPVAADELSGLCARLPLALAVVASRVAVRPGFSLRSPVAELHGESDLLGSLDAGEEPASVRVVFSWSYRQLPAAAARMFRLLGVHPGPDITAAAAASLAGVPVDRCRATLRDLATVGLLTEHVPGRYMFHDLLREVSTGWIGKVADRLARSLAGFHADLREALPAEPVLLGDETPVNAIEDSPETEQQVGRSFVPYVLAFRTPQPVWLSAGHTRGHAALDAFALIDRYTGTFVSDDYGGYGKYECFRTLATTRAYCRIQSYLATTRLHHIPAMDTIRAALTATPGAHSPDPIVGYL